MGGTEVELQYFTKEVKMNKGLDIKSDLIEEIGKKYHINVRIKDKAHPAYPQVIISMTSEDEAALKEGIREILELYGKPDLPMSLFGGGKKKGNELVRSVMKKLSL